MSQVRVDLVTESLGAGLKNGFSVVRCIDPSTPVSSLREHEDFLRDMSFGVSLPSSGSRSTA